MTSGHPFYDRPSGNVESIRRPAGAGWSQKPTAIDSLFAPQGGTGHRRDRRPSKDVRRTCTSGFGLLAQTLVRIALICTIKTPGPISYISTNFTRTHRPVDVGRFLCNSGRVGSAHRKSGCLSNPSFGPGFHAQPCQSRPWTKRLRFGFFTIILFKNTRPEVPQHAEVMAEHAESQATVPLKPSLT